MLIPAIRTEESPETIIGPYWNAMEQNYLFAIQCTEGTALEDHFKRASGEIKESRQLVGSLFEELRKHGFYPDTNETTKLQFVKIMTELGNEQIDPKHVEEKNTGQKAGMYRFRIVMMVYNNEMDRKEAIELQKKTDAEVIRFFEG